jgi:UDP-N-acetylglucosamine 2-epimerase (non-hydrolysing)
MTKLRPLLVMGTRPEAIKMAPVVQACRARAGELEPLICFTGQHDEMLRPVTDYFDIHPDFDLKLMSPGQSLAQLSARCLTALDDAIEAAQPDCVVAQGDTTSVLAASLAAFYRRLPFVHVEAGLRTGNLQSPWPEEMNRRVVSMTTAIHCAPTPRAAENLRGEGVSPERIRVTGNTVIDALLATLSRERSRDAHWRGKHAALNDRQVVLVTAHRRENHGAGLESIFAAIASLAGHFAHVAFVFPVHLNPQVQHAAHQQLAGIDNVCLLPPLVYPEFVWLMDRSNLIVSDSGGIQEEAPSLRRPVIALRDTTERSEAVEVGAVQLVGCTAEKIEAAVSRLLTDPRAYAAMQVERSPFGDGHAAERIVEWMLETLPARTIGLTTYVHRS